MFNIFKRYYVGALIHPDEYQQQQINQIIAKLGVFNIVIFMILGQIFRVFYPNIIIDYDVLLLSVYSFYIASKSFKYGLRKTEFYNKESYNQAVKKVKIHTIQFSILLSLIAIIYKAMFYKNVHLLGMIFCIAFISAFSYHMKVNKLYLVDDVTESQDDLLPVQDKFLYYTIGYIGGRDEYQKKQLYKILSDAGIGIFIVLLILSLMIAIYTLVDRNYALLAYMLFMLMVVNIIFVNYKIKNKKIIEYKLYDKILYQQAYQFLKKRILAVFFIIFIYIASYVMYRVTKSIPILLWDIKIIGFLLGFLLIVLFVGWLLYMLTLNQLELLENDNESN